MSLVTSTPTKLMAECGRPRPQQGADGDAPWMFRWRLGWPRCCARGRARSGLISGGPVGTNAVPKSFCVGRLGHLAFELRSINQLTSAIKSMKNNPHPVYTCGDKIICVDDRFPRAIADWCDQLPRAGLIYTIRSIQPGTNPLTDCHCLGLLLEEIVNPRTSSGGETGFDHTRFSHLSNADSEKATRIETAGISAT